MSARAPIFDPMRSMTSAGGPMKMMPACAQARGQFRPLGEEAVAGMNGVGLRRGRGVEKCGDREIALRRRRRSDPDGLIGDLHVQRIGVGVGVDRDALDSRLAAGARDPDRDFAAVGDEHAPDGHCGCRIQFGLRFSRNARIPSCPSSETRCSAMRLVVTPMTSAGRLPWIFLISSLAAATAVGAEVRISRT